MNLFINAVSESGMLIIFNDSRDIISQQKIYIRGNESSKLAGILDGFLQESHIKYSALDNIVIVVGPGSFTGVRTISLMVNTIAFSHNCFLTPISYFELFSHYPIIKQSSKRDVFMMKQNTSDIEVMSNENAKIFLDDQSIDVVCGEASIGWGGKIVEKIDYPDIIIHVKLQQNTRVNPLYIKKPNIC